MDGLVTRKLLTALTFTLLMILFVSFQNFASAPQSPKPAPIPKMTSADCPYFPPVKPMTVLK